jgi:hypothetical protein
VWSPWGRGIAINLLLLHDSAWLFFLIPFISSASKGWSEAQERWLLLFQVLTDCSRSPFWQECASSIDDCSSFKFPPTAPVVLISQNRLPSENKPPMLLPPELRSRQWRGLPVKSWRRPNYLLQIKELPTSTRFELYL